MQALGIFASDYYAQGPALTLHRFGEGRTYYIATQGSDELLSRLTHLLCQEAVIPPVMNAPQGVEATARVQTDRHILYFLLNHNETTAQVILPAGKFTSLLTGEEVEGQLEIAARDVVVLLHRS